MASIEERLTAIEHENAELKQTIELHTIAIGALVNFDAIDNRLNTMDGRFDRLEALLAQVIERLPPQL